MRKCVSMVAVASAAFGLAACSSPDQHQEPAGVARVAETAAAPGSAHAAPLAAAPARAAAAGQKPQAAPGAQHNAAPAFGTPVLIPSGTTSLAPLAGHPHPASARPDAAAQAPAAPHPAPPPPPAQNANIGYDANAAATAQIVSAVAAAQMDGKEVLLDFGANWCTACRALDKAMHTPKVRAVLERSYHVVQIDLGNGDPQHMSLASQYDAPGTFGMPLLVVLNPDGSVRADSARSGQPKYTEADMSAWLNQWAAR